MIKRGQIIAIIGIDGSGKSTLAKWLQTELESRGYKPKILWSRYNNYFSLPFLALTKLTGHNYYKINDGVRMGYHDFEHYPFLLKVLFIILQILDVNVATLLKLTLPSRNSYITICERGPWDTIVDVVADTYIERLTQSLYSKLFYWQLSGRSHVILIERDLQKIFDIRTELTHDHKLQKRKLAYKCLAKNNDWIILENNDTLEDAKVKLSNIVSELLFREE
jgi:molybdopterin-guanine dinucleotide biosynthesis protein